MLRDPELEAVAIATPVSSHYPLALAALEAGKHVFIEKPLAASTDEALKLIAAAELHDLVLMPGHTFLYSPPVNLIKSMIDTGELGDIYFISTSRVNLGLHQRDVSVAWDLGPHDFSILRYWLDETPMHATAFSRGCVIPDTPDVAFINLKFPSGTIAPGALLARADEVAAHDHFVGSRRWFCTTTRSHRTCPCLRFGSDAQRSGDLRRVPADLPDGRHRFAAPRGGRATCSGDERFCRAIREGTVPRSSRELGLEVVRIIEAVDASLDQNGSRIELASAARVLI